MLHPFDKLLLEQYHERIARWILQTAKTAVSRMPKTNDGMEMCHMVGRILIACHKIVTGIQVVLTCRPFLSKHRRKRAEKYFLKSRSKEQHEDGKLEDKTKAKER